MPKPADLGLLLFDVLQILLDDAAHEFAFVCKHLAKFIGELFDYLVDIVKDLSI
jgi:hypothetical protein